LLLQQGKRKKMIMAANDLGELCLSFLFSKRLNHKRTLLARRLMTATGCKHLASVLAQG